MSRFKRALLGQETLLDKLVESCFNFIEYLGYYKLRGFVRNIYLFSRLAWLWRPWDYTHTINVLVVLLKEQAKCIRAGHNVRSEQLYRRTMTAAGKLDRAYNHNMASQVSRILRVMYPGAIYKKSEKYLRNKEFYDKLYNIARKREEQKVANNKKEAWEYLSKYIEHFWD